MAEGREGEAAPIPAGSGDPAQAIRSALVCTGVLLGEANAEMLEMPQKCAW